MTRLRHLAPLALLLTVAASACVAATAPTAGGTEPVDDTATTTLEVPRTTGIPTMRPTPAAALGIVLDSDGRPYDVEQGPGGTIIESGLVARLRIDRGLLEVLDGESLYRSPPPSIADTESVRLATDSELELHLIRQRPDPEGEPDPGSDTEPESDTGSDPEPDPEPEPESGRDGRGESILGVRLVVPGSQVTRWGRFEPAYTTTEGLGAVTSRAVLESAARRDLGDGGLLDDRPSPDRPYVLADLDGEPGHDVFLFDDGGGEGPVVLSEGFDAEDRLVAVMLWHPRYPWRLAVPAGTPPPDVVDREQELIDCIEGRRLIDRWGRCT